jgi:hypothetical protein
MSAMASDQYTRSTKSDVELVVDVENPHSHAHLEQQYRWRALAAAHLIRFDRQPDRLLLTYEAMPAVRSEVSDLIHIEEQRSPFLTWIMVDNDDGLIILIQGNEQLLDELDPIIRNDSRAASP